MILCAIHRGNGCGYYPLDTIRSKVWEASRKHGAIARKHGHRAFSHRDFHQRLMASAGVEGCRQVGLEAAWIRRLPRVSSKDQLGLCWSEALNIRNFDRLWSVWPLISASTCWLWFSRLLACAIDCPITLRNCLIHVFDINVRYGFCFGKTDPFYTDFQFPFRYDQMFSP